MNEINALEFYRKSQMWVYDDPTYGKVAEPLILGASEMLDYIMLKQLGYVTRENVNVTFSSNEFPNAVCGYHHHADSTGGDWYTLNGEQAWLCPALMDYFTKAPDQLWVSVCPIRKEGWASW